MEHVDKLAELIEILLKVLLILLYNKSLLPKFLDNSIDSIQFIDLEVPLKDFEVGFVKLKTQVVFES